MAGCIYPYCEAEGTHHILGKPFCFDHYEAFHGRTSENIQHAHKELLDDGPRTMQVKISRTLYTFIKRHAQLSNLTVEQMVRRIFAEYWNMTDE